MAAAIIAGLAHTWRVRIEGGHHLVAARASGPAVFAPWHQALVPLVWAHRHQGITLLVGRHRDAELLAGIARRWGYRLTRGSSSRGGAAALHALIATLRGGGDGAVTPDGPRGPRHQVKPGVLKAAQASGAAILPVAATCAHSWRLNSWDQLFIPKPFAKVVIRYGPAFTVDRHADPRAEPSRQLQAALDGLAVAS